MVACSACGIDLRAAARLGYLHWRMVYRSGAAYCAVGRLPTRPYPAQVLALERQGR